MTPDHKIFKTAELSAEAQRLRSEHSRHGGRHITWPVGFREAVVFVLHHGMAVSEDSDKVPLITPFAVKEKLAYMVEKSARNRTGSMGVFQLFSTSRFSFPRPMGLLSWRGESTSGLLCLFRESGNTGWRLDQMYTWRTLKASMAIRVRVSVRMRP